MMRPRIRIRKGGLLRSGAVPLSESGGAWTRTRTQRIMSSGQAPTRCFDWSLQNLLQVGQIRGLWPAEAGDASTGLIDLSWHFRSTRFTITRR